MLSQRSSEGGVYRKEESEGWAEKGDGDLYKGDIWSCQILRLVVFFTEANQVNHEKEKGEE